MPGVTRHNLGHPVSFLPSFFRDFLAADWQTSTSLERLRSLHSLLALWASGEETQGHVSNGKIVKDILHSFSPHIMFLKSGVCVTLRAHLSLD